MEKVDSPWRHSGLTNHKLARCWSRCGEWRLSYGLGLAALGAQVILGHEGAGVVAAVGEGVTHCRPGDRVMFNWAIPCGVCFQCQRGHENICEDRGTVPDSRFHRDSYWRAHLPKTLRPVDYHCGEK
jgi:threonine dehydrogenase-like Zn-dependent dehydrogenase